MGSQFGWLDIDPCFEALGNGDDERTMRYMEFVQSAIPAGEWALICEVLQRGQLTGTERFCDEIETIIGRRIENRKQGRPRKDTRK
jgi:putative transposase